MASRRSRSVTCFPKIQILRKRGQVSPTSKKQMVLADNSIITREAGYARVAIDGIADLVPVSFGTRGEPPLLGATTLEILGFVVDPIEQKLVPRPLRDK